MKTQTILLFFLAAQFLACQQPQPEAQAAEQSSTLREGLQEVFDQNQLMGMSVLIIANGARAWEGCFGLADSSRQIPVTPNTIYRIASISKSISTVALMQLAEQGKVDLHTDVSQYLGWPLKHPKFPETAISLQQLLNHTSGLRDGSGYSDFLGEMIDKQLDIKDLLLPEGTHYTEDMYADEAPGAFFSYTNCSWGVIASVIEKVSGERFDVYCRKHIFDPLGMQASFNVLDLKDLDQLAPLYRFKDGQWVAQVDDYKGAAPAPRVYEGYRLGHNGLIFGPQGSLRSSARDLATFAFMLMNKGQWQGTQILTEESVEQLTAKHWTYDGKNGDTWDDFFLSYGYGIHHTTNRDSSDIIFPDREMMGHPGIAYGLLSDLYFDVESQTGIVFITNGSKREYTYGKNTTFYQVEEDVFATVFPHIKKLEK